MHCNVDYAKIKNSNALEEKKKKNANSDCVVIHVTFLKG